MCKTLGEPLPCIASGSEVVSLQALSPDSDEAGALPAVKGGFDGWGSLLRYVFVRPLLPFFLRAVLSLTASLPFLRKGLAALLRGKLNVDVLDAAAVGVSLLRRDFRTASLLSVLLGFGDVLADWTRKRSMTGLARHLALEVDTVWVRRGGQDIQMSLKDLTEGDLVVVRTGNKVRGRRQSRCRCGCGCFRAATAQPVHAGSVGRFGDSGPGRVCARPCVDRRSVCAAQYAARVQVASFSVEVVSWFVFI